MRNDEAFPPVIVIGGPTASGKSALALALAERLHGVIVNADSMQLYAALPILSASPERAMMAVASHRLYGVLPPNETSTAAAWCGLARREIAAALQRGRQPIVVGGTGLYLEALTQGLSDIPPVPEDVRLRARAELATMGNPAFHARLVAADPASAHLAAGDSHRILRAWEVLQATARPLSDWQSERSGAGGFSFRCVAIIPPRDALYRACDARFQHMMGQGALSEVEALILGGGEAWPAMRTLGARPLADHIKGLIDRETAIALAQAATRQYAKRQTTWFRNRFMREAGAQIFETPTQVLTGF
jgi:tRNA dimethylallyltransferase